MPQKNHTGQRILRTAGITLFLIGLASQPAIAQQATTASADGMTVVRDPASGKLRGASASEAAALKAAARERAVRTTPQATQPKFHANGARGARLTDEFVSQAVAVRKPDGSLEMQCFDSHGAAGTAVATGHVHNNMVTE